jgi:hypothetical protein
MSSMFHVVQLVEVQEQMQHGWQQWGNQQLEDSKFKLEEQHNRTSEYVTKY